MAEARSEVDWDHTASLMALIAEIKRDPKKKSDPYKPSDFHLHAKAKQREGRARIPKVKMKDIKSVLMGLKPRHEKRR